tara:strand:+ start:343 stop:612 length:270 start_codon:yes stop_codon:yes gene_type:complete
MIRRLEIQPFGVLRLLAELKPNFVNPVNEFKETLANCFGANWHSVNVNVDECRDSCLNVALFVDEFDASTIDGTHSDSSVRQINSLKDS